MTEAEWLGCTEPTLMLQFLRGKTTDRKLRLFAVACCRHIWHLLSDARSRNSLEVTERFADGMATELERQSAKTSGSAAMEALYPAHNDYAALAVVNAASENAFTFINADTAAFTAATAADDDDDPTNEIKWLAERLWQADILRDIMGNPFQPVSFESSWGTSNVMTLARAAYFERAFDQMPIMADALQKASCDSQAILAHCRRSGEHVRGCWVVDLLLGKE